MDEILNYCDEPVDPSSFEVPKDRSAAYLVDFMALVRPLSGVLDTYKSLSYMLFSMIPKEYEKIDTVADTYHEQSVKNPQRLSVVHQGELWCSLIYQRCQETSKIFERMVKIRAD